jgi:Domain of unknown function (DUF5664)
MYTDLKPDSGASFYRTTDKDDFYDQMMTKWVGELSGPENSPRDEGERWHPEVDYNQMMRNTPLVLAVKAKMNEAIERQQQQDMAKDDNIDPVTGMKKNMKDAFGLAKARTMAIPSVAIFGLGAAMQNGADKYEAFNYRESVVKASIFHEAKMRHALDWYDGEDFAEDSLVNHLCHEMACCAIILDAIANGNFEDDRPKKKLLGASRLTNVWKKA